MTDAQFKQHLEALGFILDKLEDIRCGLTDVEEALKPQEIDIALEEGDVLQDDGKVRAEILGVLKDIQYNTNLLRG